MALSDVYGKRGWAPSQDLLQQQTAGAASLPGLHQQGMAIKEAETEQGRLNRPVTPWQKAIMRIMAGEDPAVVAGDTKAELGGGAAGPSGAPPGGQIGAPGGVPTQGAPSPGYATSSGAAGILGGMSDAPVRNLGQGNLPPSYGPATPGQAAAQMPQVTVTREQPPVEPNRVPLNASRSFLMDRNPLPQERPAERIAVDNGGGGWQGRGGISDATFDGMNGRDYRDYVAGMHQAQGVKQQRDYMAIERERTRRALGVEDKRGASRKEVADIKADVDYRRMALSDKARTLERLIKEKALDERTAHHISQIEVAYARIQELEKQFNSAYGQKDRLEKAKILAGMLNTETKAFSQVEAALSGIVALKQEGLASDMRNKKEDMEALKVRVEEELRNAEASEKEAKKAASVKKSAPKTAPVGGTRQYKRKGNGQTINATPEQFEQAVTSGRIKREEWE